MKPVRWVAFIKVSMYIPLPIAQIKVALATIPRTKKVSVGG
jgi:hypothetical protein